MSVVVPVYNEASVVGDCLAALADQTYPDDRYELLVVDNGSTDATPAIVRDSPATLVSAPERGQYAARNAGIDRATGEVFAFTDADATVARDWIEAGVGAVRAVDGPVAVYGRVDPALPDRPNRYERYDAIRSFDPDHRQTWNLFTTRAAFEVAGRFRGDLLSGGDVEWADRAADRGVAIRHDDAVLASHPPRDSWGALYGMSVRRGYGSGQRMRTDRPEGRAGLLAREPLRLFDWYRTVARDLAAGSGRVETSRADFLVFAAMAIPLGIAMGYGRVRGILAGEYGAVGDYG